MHATRTETPTRTVAHCWHLAAPITSRDALAVARATADTGCTLAAHPATLEAMGRAVSPFGPIARTAALTGRVLGCPVEADPAMPEGFVAAVR